jgi:hypothetical protein
MTFAFVVIRANGEKTSFDFTDDTGSLDKTFVLLREVGVTQSDLFTSSAAYQNLKQFSDVTGLWQSSDDDPDAVAVDIQTEIRRKFGFETKVSMYDAMGKPTVGGCDSGRFLVERISK